MQVSGRILAFAVLAAIVMGSNAESESNRSVVSLLHARVWNEGRVDLIPEFYSERFVGHFPGGDVQGHAGIRARVEGHRVAFPDWHETVDDWIVQGDKVVTRFTSRGTNLGAFLGRPATGKTVEISEVAIFRLDGGKIVEQWVYPDMRSMQLQLYGPDAQ